MCAACRMQNQKVLPLVRMQNLPNMIAHINAMSTANAGLSVFVVHVKNNIDSSSEYP